ncbi:PhzF family phenazine biosynthesis protein [Actinomadura sp. ATCC 31491]|uniref:PhzF family phenazine biosynthesis protein n=1 Tax=Actinomadura luzonensis TaxID=2805427 RepID=A0ABT0FMU3_9ACTN|nr:PhzF family phenazine biosynthesis protein [Actinomadura luzonensis]MCK2213607.1 PhzF family phenazine biosynthesis protein [Actinomadura luzonensis]
MRLFTVDAFTSAAFQGNPAAVCLLDSPVTDEWMRSVAAEMNLSETAFLHGDSLRWFTPAVEVTLCGHATLATAHVLYSTGEATGQLEFRTASGTLTVNRLPDGLISMDFPAKEVTPTAVPDGLEKALGATPVRVGKSALDLLVELDSAETVRDLAPDIAALAAVDARGVIVTARGTETDFVSRFFAPNVGVPEDPVTGSAHCALSPYWSARLGRASLVGAQLSKRGGIVRVTHAGNRVTLAGNAVTVLSGTLHV